MKKINYVILFQLFVLLNSCIEDNGNYVYQDEKELLPIEITGLEKEMTVMKGNVLSLTPIVENMTDPSRYTSEWFIMEYQAGGFAPKRRDLQKGIDLNWTVNMDPGLWRLNFQVTDTKLNVYKRYEILLNITGSPLAIGWYILKDNDEGTELDYITTEGVSYSNALRQRIPGKAVSIGYQSSRYYHTITDENGKVTTLTNLPAFHVLTTQDIYTYNAKDMVLLKKYKEQFYTLPSECSPQAVLNVGADMYMANANKVHSIYGMSANIGKYSAPVTGIYSLYPALIPFKNASILVFDASSHSFYNVSSMNTSLLSIGDVEIDDEIYSFAKMSYDLHCIGSTSTTGNDGQSYVVMKHLEKDESILVRITATFSVGTFASVRDIPMESKLTKTQLIAPAYSADFLYFVLGQTVYSYKNATGLTLEEKEQPLLTFPDDEEIVMIRNVYVLKKMNVLAVVTNKAGQWKLYIYNLKGESTPEIELAPIAVYEGEGNARYFMYRSL